MIVPFQGKVPQIAPDAFVAPNAVIIGNVIVESGASIWYGAVLRADFNQIKIGRNANVQDNCVIHVDDEHPTIVENCVTIGHGSVLEGCTIREGSVIGMNSTLLKSGEIGPKSLIGAGSLTKVDQKIPEYHLAAGVPAKVKKALSDESAWWVENAWKEYYALSRRYLKDIKVEDDHVK